MENTKEAIQSHQVMCNDTRARLKEHDLLGPWMDEPDRVEFQAYGLDCLLVRNHSMFQWCGYVGVSLDHPNVKRLVKKKLKLSSHEKEYLEDEEDDLEVHGGITYREECNHFICHITEKEDKLFWFGFDCAHFGDMVPGMDLNMRQIRKLPDYPPEAKEMDAKLTGLLKELNANQSSFNINTHYRDMNYVIEETKQLARQLHEKQN